MDEFALQIASKYQKEEAFPDIGAAREGISLTQLLDLGDYPGHRELVSRNDAYESTWLERESKITSNKKRVQTAHKTYEVMTIGDVKYGFQASDHDGWVLLDGRATSLLSGAHQAAAASLGFGTNLPNATDKYISQASAGSLGSSFGNNEFTLLRSHLPNEALTGATDSVGSHVHQLYKADGGVGILAPGPGQADDSSGRIAYDSTASRWMDPSGDHTHNVTTESLNGNVTQVPIDRRACTLKANAFMYLGV